MLKNALWEHLIEEDPKAARDLFKPGKNWHYIITVEEYEDRKRIIIEKRIKIENVEVQKKLMEIESPIISSALLV